MVWIRACAVTDVPDGEALSVDHAPAIALFNVGGEFFATADRCTHAESSLSQGYLDGDEVECSWHFAKFCVRTGKAKSLPATEDLPTYPVKLDGGAVFIDAPVGD